MILGFKKHFPDGESTFFLEKIFAGIGLIPSVELEPDAKKIHTMREGDRWQAGNSIQMVYNHRTPNQQQFNQGFEELLGTCASTQKVTMFYNVAEESLQVYVDGRKLRPHEIKRLIKNDGLIPERFVQWFFAKSNSWSGQIIHWTNFKY
jgi:hypothetical protein